MAAAHAEAEAALARLAAARLGEKSSRAWLVGVVQADAVGAAETKEFADAYLASFMMRGRVAQAIFLWNVAQIKLARAAGTLTASAPMIVVPPGESK
ncbi:MAG: hypothetical protein IPL79_02375 [Myxococcales bacterium]|nr:hypothetical protein [Myxococcales bacterium]